MECPECERNWPEETEQSIAIAKRGKCIVCLVEAKEPIGTDPYEFEPNLKQENR